MAKSIYSCSGLGEGQLGAAYTPAVHNLSRSVHCGTCLHLDYLSKYGNMSNYETHKFPKKELPPPLESSPQTFPLWLFEEVSRVGGVNC